MNPLMMYPTEIAFEYLPQISLSALAREAVIRKKGEGIVTSTG